MRKLKFLIRAFTLPLFLGFIAWAADITGQVTDPAGASVPRARISVSLVGGAKVQTATTDDSGRFVITDIPDGVYKVRVYASVPASALAGGREGWLDTETDTVRVTARGKTTIDVKVRADAFAAKK